MTVRRARTPDVPAIRALIDLHTADRRLLGKATVTLYEDVQEFWVAVRDDALVGCGALHVLWADLAEVRTVAVDPSCRGQGIGSLVLARLLEQARKLGVGRVFCLTFETAFFARHGFAVAEKVLVDAGIQAEMLQSTDEGVAEFLDLARVRPNTLGNTRMLADLASLEETRFWAVHPVPPEEDLQPGGRELLDLLRKAEDAGDSALAERLRALIARVNRHC